MLKRFSIITDFHLTLLLVVVLALTIAPPWSYAAEIKAQTLKYSVRYTKHDAGELEIIINHENNAIKTTVISHLSAVAKLLLSGLTAETWFVQSANGYQLSHGQVLSHDNKSVKRKFQIDRSASTLQFDDDPATPLDAETIYEFTSFPLVLITSDISKIAGKRVNEVSVKRSRAYIYTEPQAETLEANGRSYQTWKVSRHKVNDVSRTVTMWLDKENGNIPVRIVTSRKGKDTVFELLVE